MTHLVCLVVSVNVLLEWFERVGGLEMYRSLHFADRNSNKQYLGTADHLVTPTKKTIHIQYFTDYLVNIETKTHQMSPENLLFQEHSGT